MRKRAQKRLRSNRQELESSYSGLELRDLVPRAEMKTNVSTGFLGKLLIRERSLKVLLTRLDHWSQLRSRDDHSLCGKVGV